MSLKIEAYSYLTTEQLLSVLKCIEITVCADHAITRSTAAVSTRQDRRRHDDSQSTMDRSEEGEGEGGILQAGLEYNSYNNHDNHRVIVMVSK